MEYSNQEALTLKKWIIFSSLGWIFGVVMVILIALFLEGLRLGFSSQAVVGLGMGLGVGTLQWLILKRYLKINTKWIIASVGGFGFSYIMADIILYVFELKPEIIMPIATGLGALISAWFQEQLVLKKLVKPPYLWVPYSFTAWIIAHAITMGLFYMSPKLIQGLPPYLSFTIAILFLMIEGPILGYISSFSILPVVNQTIQKIKHPFE